MLQPAPSLGTASAPPAASEIVHRPDPGLARGRWEAPSWFFFVVFGVVAAIAIGWAAVRLGLLKRLRKERRS